MDRTANPGILPAQLPDVRNSLLDKWRPGGIYERLINSGVVRSMFHPQATSEKYPNEQVIALSEASLYWVSTEMVDILNSAAAGIPIDCTPNDLTFPAPHGLVYFESPIMGTDAHGIPYAEEIRKTAEEAGLPMPVRVIDNTESLVFPINAIVWATGVQAPIPARPEPTSSVSVSSYQYRELGWVNLGKSDWPIVDPLDKKPFPVDDTAFFSFMEDRRFLAALFTLLQQESIAATETVVAPRQVRRRSERAGVNAPSDVKLVTLRRLKRTKPEDGETAEVAWSHRWMVNGHWRWQPVGPGRRQRRLTYVTPHIKGPEDAPLKVKETVNVWVR